MKIVLDTSVVIALLSSKKERELIIDKISGNDFICPESVIPEIGNAISAMFKRKRITLEEGIKVIKGFKGLKISFFPLNSERAVEICHEYNIYAYDAYILECAERFKLDLITLDKRMKEVAKLLNIFVIEV
jgi:predicted nucleic acid-binding protein